jgi:hypothetical protein
MTRFGAGIFLSAFLLFAVQPLVGKALLPWFGGAPAVWTTCLFTFQVLLLSGYAWTHLIGRLSPRGQIMAHMGLIATTLSVLIAGAVSWGTPLLPDISWRPADSSAPVVRTLRVLLVGAALPCLALSATSPLLQRWSALLQPHRPPWRLYSLSNVGSLAALAVYPFAIEPLLPLRVQAWAFGAIFLSWAVTMTLCAAALVRLPTASVRATEQAPAPRWSRRLAWIGLAALPSSMLLAVTNHLCQEIAAVPFLWILPLASYLLSFILCFDSDRWYSRARFAPALSVLLLLAGACLVWRAPVLAQVPIFSLLLFAAGMVCHGELALRKPDPSRLSGFYLAVASGGVLGGALVSLLAPLVFDSFLELDLGLLACALLVAVLLAGPGRPALVRIAVDASVFVVGGLVVAHVLSAGSGSLFATRSFYGVLRVVRDDRGPGGARRIGLLHGATTHGFQIDRDPFRSQAAAYYTARSGIGLAFGHLARRSAGEPIRVGVLGLGIGTLATYGRQGDTFRFYELSPDVARLAWDRAYFSYLGGSRASIEVVLGDGRSSLEHELAQQGSQRFDLLVADAFGSDSVPVHLLTREAFALFLAHMREPRSILAVNVLNRTLDLPALVYRLADELGLTAVRITATVEATDPLALSSDWMLLARDPAALAAPDLTAAGASRPGGALPRLWTDDYSNLASLLRVP